MCAYIHVQYMICIQNRNTTLYRCTTLNFDNLKELIQYTLFTICLHLEAVKLQWLLFQHNHREIQDTFRFLRIIACLQIAVEEDNDSLKKQMSMHKPHSSSLFSLSDCVCNCVFERICGESDMSEMHVLCVRIPPNLDNWARWPISSLADAVIQRRDTSTLTL